MSRLTSIDVKDGVTDIQDLQYATNLESISISTDNVTNLDILCRLPKITKVSFGFQNKVDITFMKAMKNVESVYFNNSEIVGGDVSYLVASPKLKDLFFYDPDAPGIEFLKGATELETIELWHAISESDDISVLKTLPKLKSLEILTYGTIPSAHKKIYEELVKKGVSVDFI
jgi:hypothetical protein